MLIKRCLTYGIKIYPHQLDLILKEYERHKVPDEKLAVFNGLQTEKYVRGLYLCGQEMACDWTRGNELLKELGFKESIRKCDNRSFVSMVFDNNFNPN